MKEKKLLRPRMELQAHLVATRITPPADDPVADTTGLAPEQPQDIMSIIERELAKIRAQK